MGGLNSLTERSTPSLFQLPLFSTRIYHFIVNLKKFLINMEHNSDDKFRQKKKGVPGKIVIKRLCPFGCKYRKDSPTVYSFVRV